MSEKYEKGGVFYDLKKWLSNNSEKFGFFLTYNNDPKRKGFEYEPWHYSYAPLAIPYLRKFILLDLEQVISKASLLGGTVLDSNFLKRYKTAHILDINPKLL